MVRSSFLFAAVAIRLACSAAVAQPAKAPPQPVSIAERMSKPVKFEFDKMPLTEAVESLKELLLIPIVVDVLSLEESAINAEGPISGKSRGGTAFDDINDLLRPKKLAAEIRHDVLFISTLEKQSQFHVCRAYRLLKTADMGDLIKQITSKTAPDSWSDVGGTGSIANIGTKVLVVLQTPAIHREIEKKFGKQLLQVSAPLDRITALVPTKGADPLAKVREALRRPVSAEFPKRPLQEVLESLAKGQELSLVFDRNALAVTQAVNTMNVPVTVNLKEIPFESVFALVLHQMRMEWALDGEQLLITIPQVAEGRLITINYDVGDLAPTADSKVLSTAITRTVQPVSWADTKGLGTVTAADGELSITQTVQIHRMIESWLADVRTAMRPGRK